MHFAARALVSIVLLALACATCADAQPAIPTASAATPVPARLLLQKLGLDSNDKQLLDAVTQTRAEVARPRRTLVRLSASLATPTPDVLGTPQPPIARPTAQPDKQSTLELVKAAVKLELACLKQKTVCNLDATDGRIRPWTVSTPNPTGNDAAPASDFVDSSAATAPDIVTAQTPAPGRLTAEAEVNAERCFIAQNRLVNPAPCPSPVPSDIAAAIEAKLAATTTVLPIGASPEPFTFTAAPTIAFDGAADTAGVIVSVAGSRAPALSTTDVSYGGRLDASVSGTFSLRILGKTIASPPNGFEFGRLTLDSELPLNGDPASIDVTAKGDIIGAPISQDIVSLKSSPLRYHQAFAQNATKNLCYLSETLPVGSLFSVDVSLACPAYGGYWYAGDASLGSSELQIAPYASMQIVATAKLKSFGGLVSAAAIAHGDIIDVYAKAGVLNAIVSDPSDGFTPPRQFVAFRPYVFGTVRAASGYLYLELTIAGRTTNIKIATWKSAFGFDAPDPGRMEFVRLK